MLMLDQALHRGQEAAMSDAEKLTAMEAEVSGLRSLLGETDASGQKAARDINLVRAAAAQQRLAHGRDICALEEEMRRVKEAMTGIGRSLGQQESNVSGLKEVLGHIEGKHEQLRVTVTRQSDELAETRRQNEELGGRVWQLEEENRRLRHWSEGSKGQLTRVEAGQQSAVAHLQEEIVGG
jgi:chromosome segregation ATPase